MKRQTQLFHHLWILGAVTFTLWMPPLAYAQPETLTIAAANSVKDALRKLLPLF